MGKKKNSEGAAKSGHPTFEADGVEYEIHIGKFHFKGKVMTAEEAAENEAICAELVTIKSGVIRKVGEAAPEKPAKGAEKPTGAACSVKVDTPKE